jgi:glyoxylase-like metal-dependent hydrolase (beta-lactamase superfamily II)
LQVSLVGRLALVLALATGGACGSNQGVPPSMLGWNQAVPPFRVAGNIYYVGTNEISLFLIATPAGNVLLDSGFESKVGRLQGAVEALGFRFADIKLLLSSHAHIDHVQAHAAVRRLTGARVLASREDAAVIASGGQGDWAYPGMFSWTPCPVDQIIEDGAKVELGGTTLVAHLTPGHTRGATTWTTTVNEEGRPRAVLFFPSASVPPGARPGEQSRLPGRGRGLPEQLRDLAPIAVRDLPGRARILLRAEGQGPAAPGRGATEPFHRSGGMCGRDLPIRKQLSSDAREPALRVRTDITGRDAGSGAPGSFRHSRRRSRAHPRRGCSSPRGGCRGAGRRPRRPPRCTWPSGPWCSSRR